MGLDISYYRQLKAAPDAKVDKHGWPEDDAHHININQSLIDWVEKEWPGRTKGISSGLHSFTERDGFAAGSYGGYNQWRSDLCKLAHGVTAKEFWDTDKSEGAFAELINFADNEGYIGPEVSAKLAKDFAEFEDRAKAFDPDQWFFTKYQSWKKAFETAADGGCVDFH